ncbi:unnamed protein product [Adineta steineri]|uniref:ASD2 domain-containing protein n=1 Tax=Adineta steineri TaxID=433720 RepID=A0A813V4Y3_9BILA|nr:unnamed protein product [Adineta steineri]
MRFPEHKIDDKTILIDENKAIMSSLSSSQRDHHSSLQCHTLRQDHMPFSIDKSLPSAKYIYNEIVKAIGNNDFMEEKRLLKRSSWSPSISQESGLPPSGKRLDNEQPILQKNIHRVRMRPKVARYYHPQKQEQEHQLQQRRLFGRPISFNEKYDQRTVDHQQGKISSLPMKRTNSFSIQRREPSPSPSSSSVDTIVQITTRGSPSLDTSDFISDTSTASSVTTTNTVTSLSSPILSPTSRRRSPSYERIYSSTIRPLLSEYQQQNSPRIDYKFISPPVPQTNTIHPSSTISSSSSSTPTSPFTCPKGHEQSSSSPIGSSLNQYAGFTLQTLNIDTSRDDIGSPTTKTTRSIMTMSMSPNRHHNQTRSAKAIVTSAQITPTTNVTITANNTDDGLKQQQQRDQTESTSVSNNSCLKSPTNTNNNCRIKKSVHFDWHLPRNVRSTSSLPVKESYCSSNYRPTVRIASSSSLSNSNGNSNGDKEEQKKLCDDQRLVGTLREKDRIETTRRTITTNPLTTTNTILRSFSLSPSPLSKEESNNDSRRHRGEEKKENVDELNCTTSRRVTTAATHLHCTTTTATVTFNDGSNNVSQKKESNSTNNSNTNLLKRQSTSSIEKSMPLNNLLVKTSSLNTIINPQIPQQQQSPSLLSSSSSLSAKKIISNGFFNFIGRSNSSNNKSSTSTEENKQLRRTSSTQLRAQRKAKQQTTLTTGTNGNKRLSADVESILPVSSINNNHCEISKEDIHIFDKVTTNHSSERQSVMSLVSTTTDKNINATSSSYNDSSIPLCTNSNGINNTISMSTNSSTTIIKSDEGDSLNNGLLFRPVTDPKCDYILHDHHQTTVQKEPFFLSPPKSLSNGDESTVMQTSTLIISTPPQYHYYLYPPINNTTALSSSSSSSSVSSSSKKNSKIISTTNRTISNLSINSLSTNSSSSYPSYESQTHDNDYQQSSQTPFNAEDETLSSSTYSITNNNKTRQKKVVQSALMDWKIKSSSEISNNNESITITKTKPVILSDSVQAFWPPPPSPSTLDKHSGLTTTTTTTTTLTTTEQTKQSESIPIPSNIISSNYNNDPMNINHTDILSTKEEIGSYTDQHRFSNDCLRNASDTSLEDTQASYTERLREKSRSIPMNGNNDFNPYLKRSVSKDTLNDCQIRSNTHINIPEISLTNGQQTRTTATHIVSRTQAVPPLENDFQSKREFFENRIYTDNSSLSNISLSSIQTNILPKKPKLYTLSLSNHSQLNNNLSQQTIINNNPQRNVTRRSWNDLSSRQLPPPPTPPPPPPPPPPSSEPYFESSFNQPSFPPPPTIRKPVRIVKAIQRSPPPANEPVLTNRPLTTSKTYSLAKPGLFSASPITSSQKLPNKSFNTIRRFQSRDENDLQLNIKEFLSRYSNNHSLNDLARLTISNDYHLSTDYTRALFPIPDRLRRIRSRQSSGGDTSSITTSSNSSSDYIHRTVSNDSCICDDDDTLRQAEDLLINLNKRSENLKDNQRIIHEEMEDNKILGAKLINIIETNAESNEIEKFKLHINEIDTITSILLKLSSRLAKVENDLLMISDHNEHTKASLIDRREKAQQKHDEAKALKDGIDRRSRLVTNILRKYFSNEQYDDYEHFVRMKSTLLMDEKDIEENLLTIEKQIEVLNHILIRDYQTLSNPAENLQTNSLKFITSTA